MDILRLRSCSGKKNGVTLEPPMGRAHRLHHSLLHLFLSPCTIASKQMQVYELTI